MKNLFKSVFRSFSKNKIAIIGLVFLVFLSLGIFCVMNNTTNNIRTEFANISKKGNLHDFTVNEVYDIGVPVFEYEGYYLTATENSGIIADAGNPTVATPQDGSLSTAPDLVYPNNFIPLTGDDIFYVMVPEQTTKTEALNSKSTRTYNFKLDEEKSTGLYKSFASNPKFDSLNHYEISFQVSYSNSNIPDFVQPLNDFTSSGFTTTFDAGLNSAIFNTTFNGDTSYSLYKEDFSQLQSQVASWNTTIFNTMTTSATPMQEYLDTIPGVSYEPYNAINITTSADNIFYKVVESNPEDTIDKMVLFPDDRNNIGYNLPSVNAWKPFGAEVKFYETNGELITYDDVIGNPNYPHYPFNNSDPAKISYGAPSTYEELMRYPIMTHSEMTSWTSQEKFLYSQIIHNRFKYMYSGEMDDGSIGLTIKTIAAINYDIVKYNEEFYKINSPIYLAYDDPKILNNTSYCVYLEPSEWITISGNGTTTFTWAPGLIPVPHTCTISNWTQNLAIVNPEFLNRHTNSEGKSEPKYVVESFAFTNFEPFNVWYTKTNQTQLNDAIYYQWFNTLTFDQLNFWMYGSDNPSDVVDYDINGTVVSVSAAEYHGINENNIVDANGYDMLIWGCGITPDYIYPVVDMSRLTPNPEKECILFANSAGFNSLQLGAANSPMEQYLVCTFDDNLTRYQQENILNQINTFAADYSLSGMVIPSGLKSAYFANDTSNVLNASAYRIAYIPGLISSIQIITVVLCSFIGLIAIIICIVIIKRYIENNRVNIGILLSNGVSKWKIIFSMTPFALIPAAIGGVCGYIFGLLLQAFALSLFGAYWMLPTSLIAFSPVALIFTIIVPFVIFLGCTIFSALSVLKIKPVELMKPGSEFKTNAVSRVVKRPFAKFGILTRFRVSLAFNSIWKLVVLSVMSMLTMTALVFTMTTGGKLADAQEISESQISYRYSIELETPTSQGGPHAIADYRKGLGYSNIDNYLFNHYFSESSLTNIPQLDNLIKPYYQGSLSGIDNQQYRDAIGDLTSLFLTNAGDATGQAQDLFYLKGKMSSMMSMNFPMGALGMVSNPWDIALSLMPTNVRNRSNDSYNQVIQYLGNAVNDPTNSIYYNGGIYKIYFTPNNVDGKIVYSLDTSKVATATAMKTDFVHLVSLAYQDPNILQMEYPIFYGSVPLMLDQTNPNDNWNWDANDEVNTIPADETYTYLDGRFVSLSTLRRPVSRKEKITGIVDDSSFVKLTDNEGNEMNSLLYNEDGSPVVYDNNTYPIIVNEFAQYQYNLKIGDTLVYEAQNTANRKLEDEYQPAIVTFEVVGISTGRQGAEYYIAQNVANKILGLPDGESWNDTHKYYMWYEGSDGYLADLAWYQVGNQKLINIYEFDGITPQLLNGHPYFAFIEQVPTGFNGVFTSQEDGGVIVNGLPLYSYTGMYPPTSVYGNGSPTDQMSIVLDYEDNLAIASFVTGIPITEATSISSFVAELNRIFGVTTVYTTMKGMIDVEALSTVYDNLILTMSSTAAVIMMVIIPMTVFIVLILSSLIINDSKRLAAMLKALGYSDKKNAMSFLAIYLPVILIGLMISIPISIGLALGYQAMLFVSAGLLINVTVEWWYFIIAIGGIGLILLISYSLGYVSLRNGRLVDQIK